MNWRKLRTPLAASGALILAAVAGAAVAQSTNTSNNSSTNTSSNGWSSNSSSNSSSNDSGWLDGGGRDYRVDERYDRRGDYDRYQRREFAEDEYGWRRSTIEERRAWNDWALEGGDRRERYRRGDDDDDGWGEDDG
jgi:hypothetical protein